MKVESTTFSTSCGWSTPIWFISLLQHQRDMHFVWEMESFGDCDVTGILCITAIFTYDIKLRHKYQDYPFTDCLILLALQKRIDIWFVEVTRHAVLTWCRMSTVNHINFNYLSLGNGQRNKLLWWRRNVRGYHWRLTLRCNLRNGVPHGSICVQRGRCTSQQSCWPTNTFTATKFLQILSIPADHQPRRPHIDWWIHFSDETDCRKP